MAEYYSHYSQYEDPYAPDPYATASAMMSKRQAQTAQPAAPVHLDERFRGTFMPQQMFPIQALAQQAPPDAPALRVSNDLIMSIIVFMLVVLTIVSFGNYVMLTNIMRTMPMGGTARTT
jgi:hypothetical protein